MIIGPGLAQASASRQAVRDHARADESRLVRRLAEAARLNPAVAARVARKARDLVGGVRAGRAGGGLDAFLREYELSSKEGVMLMCLAEALIRVPDADTADRLIKDKIGGADWAGHLGDSESLFVNASTWALMLTGRLIRFSEEESDNFASYLGRLAARGGEPVIRAALTQAMRILGQQFVMGRTIDDALRRAAESEARGYRYSYDMLGEGARTRAGAERYFDAYRGAVAAIGQAAGGAGPIAGPGLSVKLSALHPRYEFTQRDRVMRELLPRLKALALAAKAVDIGLTVDAEEADRLELSLDLFEAVSGDPALAGWRGLGFAVQAYQKRAGFVLDWLAETARRHKRRIMVRLVKGAYWDTEIKHAQEQGLDGYPVFTRKAATDASYLAGIKKLFDDPEAFYPQFATHNAHTVAAVIEQANGRPFEMQRLHGMGEALYDPIVADVPCRVYAPVGGHAELLAYLVRRLLENGANSSFVNRIQDESLPVSEIIADPVQVVTDLVDIPHPRIPPPAELFGATRRNSAGIDLGDHDRVAELDDAMTAAAERIWRAAPIVDGRMDEGEWRPVHDPADRRRRVGMVTEATPEQVDRALAAACAAAPEWDRVPAEARAEALEATADAMERERAALMALCVREAGKTIPDALAEVREAVDFCRYYAAEARRLFAAPRALPGPTGEANSLALHGRGVFACVSPWNFPLAIFTGQVAAALAAGNAVIAKPAEQTPLIAAEATRLFHEAGVPGAALQLLPGAGAVVGARLCAAPQIAGVAFTGSTEVAQAINRALAARDGPLGVLIAETGGQNAMIVDSTALAEQVVDDAVASAFGSAGQRCSALRVLFVQDEVATKVLEMLAGAMSELVVGDPARLQTDVGPVIDSDARDMLAAHADRMAREGTLLARVDLPSETENGTFFGPMAFEIESLSLLKGEVFGPILHVIRYASDRLGAVIEAINDTGFGLTLGIHSRVDATARFIHDRLKVGNTYVNRNMIGAVVGVQPFGGEGLSGTGPKAGGPYYLLRFATERTLSIDTTAAGGNASLLALDEAVE